MTPQDLVQTLCELGSLLSDFRPADEDRDGDAERARTELDVALERAIGLFQALERLRPTSEERAPPQLSDVCFAGVLELSRAARTLTTAATPDDVLSATETALRKVRRALSAVLDFARADGLLVPHDADQLRMASFDLPSTLAVRKLYADFRRALRSPEDESPESVLMALRYAAGALATLLSSAPYAAARVSDRALLRRLHARLLAWAHADKDVASGLELLADIRTCADLLRDINRRQELRAHDHALLVELCAEQQLGAESWRRRLAALTGLDDALDVAIAGEASSPKDILPLLFSWEQRLR